MEATTADEQPTNVPPKRGRKAKQSEAITATSSDVPTKDSATIATDTAVKSSRYGRVIKPKSYDMEIASKIKLEPTDSVTLVQTTASVASVMNPPTDVVQPPKKRGRPEKAIRFSADIENTALSSGASHMSSDTFKLLSERRKSAERFLAQQFTPAIVHTQSTSIDHNDGEMNDQIISPKKPRSVGRGRPPKSVILQEHTSETDHVHTSDDLSETDSSQTIPTLVIQNRRGRKPKNATIDASTWNDSSAILESSHETDAAVEIESNPLPSNRPPRIKVKNPALLFNPPPESEPNDGVVVPKKRGRKRIRPLEPEDDAQLNSGPKFKCGNCQLEIPKSRWKAHELQHFGVTYRVGIDEAIDVDDAGTQCRIITRYIKHNKIQYLKCTKCGEKKRSALGYISHVEVCGLTQDEVISMKAECEYCKKLYRKVSLPSHQQSFCTVRRLEVAQQKADEMIKTACETEPNDQLEEVIYSESGRPKRLIKKVKAALARVVDEFIKVGSKITGGTIKNWTNQLQEDHIIHCSNEKCTFQTDNVDGMRAHFKQCRESILQCRICNRVEHSRGQIVEHIESTHANLLNPIESDEDGDNADDDDFKETNESTSESSDGECDNDDGDDDDDLGGLNKKSVRKKSEPGRRNRAIPLKRVMEEDSPSLWEMVSTFYTQILHTRPGYYRKTNQWTKEFIEQNYDLNVLALKQHVCTDIATVRMPQRELNKFLNLMNLKSPTFLCRHENQYRQEKSESLDGNWNRLNFLESVVNPKTTKTNSAVLFCGGKIIAAEWIPFPSDYSGGNQVLAICAQSKGSKPISATNGVPPEKCKTLIQLWSISAVKANTTIDSTEFMYGIAYEYGPICTMAFCPSDAYVASKRLAIIALPDTNGNVNIISLPDNIPKAKGNAPAIIKVKTNIKLRLGFSSDENRPQTITQLTWSRVKGHKVLCAGYNTGLVAIWNFDHLNFAHMCRKDTEHDGIAALVPQFTFLGALSLITQLDLHSDNEDNVRWVLVGALDRRVRLYDLHDPQLVPYTSPLFKSRVITGTWPMHWPIYLTIIDAALTRMNGGLHIKSVLYTDNQPRSTNLCVDCEPSNLSFSDWLNTGIFGTDAGDLIMINFQQLLLHDRYDESSEQKLISSTDTFQEERPTIISEEAEPSEDFKVLFKDFNEIHLEPKMNIRIAPFDQYPFARITRTAINPNESHQKLYAIGYELGFCRIQFMP